jgi:hypothetical protein
MKQGWNSIDPIVRLLFVGTFMSIAVMVLVDKVLHEDAQVFQVIAGLVSGLSSAMLLRIKDQKKEDPNSTEITKTQTSTVQVTPPVDK